MSLWDGQQREWLQAMGYSLLALAGDEAVVAAEPVAEARACDEGPVRADAAGAGGPVATEVVPPRSPRTPPPRPDDIVGRGRDPAPAPRPRTGAADKAAALDAARRAGAARQAEGPLWEALLRATRQSPALAARTLRELEIDIDALRDDPQAKRGLWLRLRGLRRGGRR